MPIAQTDVSSRRNPLRLWPGVIIVVLQLLGWLAIPVVLPDATPYGVMGGLLGGVLIVLWWLFFSRAKWLDRLFAIGLTIVALFVTSRLVHVSIATGGMGMLFYMYAVPILSFAFVAWAVTTRSLSDGRRRAAGIAILLVACGGWTVVRTGGFTGDLDSDFSWRWAKTPEDQLVAQTGDELMALPSALPGMENGIDWPGFRGPNRDGVIPGVQIETDWSASPPVELWRRPVGPGWSSFAAHGELFYTQEQRGDDEVVSCYKLSTGEPVWRHRDSARFWESNGGAGPRGTPTLHNGRVYSFGGTGILNALDARTGELIWSRNAASDSGATVPVWGFSGSPLVIDDLVVVAASGNLVAFDVATGDPQWSGPVGGEGYSSPQRFTIDGVEQVVQLSGDGVIGIAPNDGTLLWEHSWGGYPIVQPALTGDGDILISVSADSGLRRLSVRQRPDGWNVEERWTSIGLKPYSSDFVVHNDHAYGFDGSILSCIGLEDGKRKWKGGRYGLGQLVLLPDQDLMLVLTEHGELALVRATPDRFEEIALLPAIEGKTWGHPVLVHDVLLVRNGEEMVAFRLSTS